MYKVGDQILGKYSILSEFYPGQFGQVFHVYNYAMDRFSVLKLVKSSDPGKLLELIEVISQKISSHRNVVLIHAAELIDGGSNDVTIAMELEYVSEGTLQDRINCEFLSAYDVVQIIKDVLYGLHFANINNVVHGDVKPDNIFLSPSGAKIADFGLSQNRNLVGNPRAQDCVYVTHATPEWFDSTTFNYQADVYAAGVTLFRAINNIQDWNATVWSVPKPFSHVEAGTLLKAIGYQPYVPQKLKRIINKACHPSPQKRYSSCAEFRNALERLVFEHYWIRVDATCWISNGPGQNEELKLETKGGFEVVHRKNGRRKNDLCVVVGSHREGQEVIAEIVKTTSIA